MEWPGNPYILTMLATSAIALGIARLAWTKRPNRGASSFTLLSLALAIWTLGYALEFGAATLEGKTTWALFQYLGVATVPVFWIIFVIRYTRHERWHSRRNIGLLFIVPILTIIMSMTNNLHGLIISETALRSLGSHQILERVRFGWYFWAVHSTYSYSLILLGMALLMKSVITSPQQYHGQITALVCALAVGLLGNFIYLTGHSPFPYIDITPFTFLLAMAAIAWGIFRNKLFDIVPIAYQSVLQNMNDIVLIVDTTWHILDANENVQLVTAMKKSKLMGESVFAVFDYWSELLKICHADAAPESEITADFDGTAMIFEASISRLHSGGDLLGYLLVLRDITERKTIEKQLSDSHQRLELALAGADMGLWDWHLAKKEIYMNQRWANILGYDHSEISSEINKWLASVHPDHRTILKDAIHAHLQDKAASIDLEIKLHSKTGEWKWTLLRGRIAERDPAGRPVRVSGTMLDINALKTAQEELLRQSRIDYLTGIYNRRYFYVRVRETMSYISRKGTVSALAILDIDHFKVINDTYGHQAGDAVLKQFATQLKDSLRMYDILARFGGEEFIFFFFDTTREQAAIIMERIKKTMQDLVIQHEGHQITFTFSAGIADTEEIGDQAILPEPLIAIADKRLYRAKERGRNRISY